jgi:hypothetical protein
MANYSNDFQAIGAASGMPSGFTNRWLSTATFSTTDSGSGNIALTQAISTQNIVGISMDAVDGDANRDNGEVLLKMRASALYSSTTACGAMCRGSGSSGSENMYLAGLSGGMLQIAKVVSGAYTLIASDNTIINEFGETAAFATVFYWMRFRYVGTALKCRIWRHDQSEPGTWDIETTDSSVTGVGWAGILGFRDATYDFSDIAVATNSDTASMTSPPPVLSAPTGTATGSANANAGATIDTVSGSGSRILYALPRVGGSAAGAAAIIASGTQLAVTTSGAKTIPLAALTTNVSAVADMVYVDATLGTSNVVTTGSFTPQTLAISGTTLGSQTAVTGAALTWGGSTPESLVTNTGVGTAGTPWTVLSGAGASGATCNSSTGILVVATAGTVGTYNITLQRADGSTAGSAIPQTVTKTVDLVITTGGAASALLLGGPSAGIVGIASTNFTVSANGTISGTVSVSPTDSGGGGAFTPSSVNISSGSPTATFTYTPGTAGTKSITVTNGGGLSNPAAISYVATAATGGTLTISDFKQWTGTPHVSITVAFVKVFRLSDGVLALELTSQAVNAGSDMVIQSNGLSAGIQYMVFGFSADGSLSFKKRVTST